MNQQNTVSNNNKEDNKTKEWDNMNVHVKFKLSALWTALMMLYIYADIYSLYRPGQLEHIQSGLMGPFQVTQTALLLASILTAIPALMIFLSLALTAKVNRIVNMLLGCVYILVSVGNLMGETWIYYLMYGVIELLIFVLIIFYAFKWPVKTNKEV